MKILINIAFLFLSIVLNAQTAQFSIPSVDLKTIEGKKFNTSEIKNEGKPIIIDFWATWCKPCVMELNAIADKYADWQKETGVVLYAISIDDAKSINRVAPFVNAKGWEYVVLLDPNGDFKRAMNVINIPHTFIIDGKGNIVEQHTTYAEGDEYKMFEILKKMSNNN
ncbi:MAG: TlpA family protein disulfide reductase [Bacteroidales bacterium]